MQLRAFTIPLHDTIARCLSDRAKQANAAAEEVNAFLRTNRIVSVDRHFVPDGVGGVWAICVSYLGEANRPQAATSKRPKVDYREILSAADFALFAKLRDLRKELAEREGIPAYALFTNEHLAEMVQRRVHSATALKHAVRDTLEAVSAYLHAHRRLEIKKPVRLGRSTLGLSFCGFLIQPGAILLSRRRRRRYAEVRARWEHAFSIGLIDARGLQAGYASALGMTAAADARAWRAEQLRRVPLGEKVAHV